MEAPEKIYVRVKNSKIFHTWNSEWIGVNDIEYTRTDALIEKVVEWLEDHKWAVETEDNGIMGWIPDYFIEDFKNYMKGE